MIDRDALLALLNDLQQELKKQALWDSQPPAAEAFQSETPFHADTMDFSQWLQWVFVQRFRAILEADGPLPQQCDVTPMAEEALKGMEQDTSGLINLLQQFDDHF